MNVVRYVNQMVTGADGNNLGLLHPRPGEAGMRRTVTAMVLGLLMTRSHSFARCAMVAPGARVEKLAGGFHFTGEPTCEAEGNAFVTDQPNDRIPGVERGSP